MRYVTVMSASGKVVAVGKLEQYYGKWLTVRRNDNEVVAVNTDFVQAIHFMEIPTQGMLESMLKSAPTVETAPPADGKRAPIAVKSTSNSRMPPS